MFATRQLIVFQSTIAKSQNNAKPQTVVPQALASSVSPMAAAHNAQHKIARGLVNPISLKPTDLAKAKKLATEATTKLTKTMLGPIPNQTR